MHDVVDQLPGEELLRAGLADLAAGQETAAALAVAMAASRLRSVGIDVPSHNGRDCAHRLYGILVANDPEGAHSQFNALVRRLASLLRAAEHAPAG